ncbi:MAG: glycosyltransferase family 39 protein, partial [Candidatus Hydrogenedentes bacterium]|nr:glycosyltransferase family 39 protein [Candidatus Hydrogenedentota bacterium]
MLDVELFGMRPGAHHGTNVAIHALACVLLLAFLGYSTRLWHRSAAVAALFALHPLHVESVAWVAERKDVLCAVFFFLSLLAYARFVRRRSWYAYATALLAFALALMAKPMAVTLPFVLLLIDVWPLKRVSLPKLSRTTAFTLLVEKVPFIVLSGAVSVATFRLQHQVEGVRSLGDTGLGLRTANALVSYASY